MKNWSLNAKIYSVLFIFILGSITISYLGIAKMDEVKDSLNRIVNGSSARVGNAQDLKALFLLQAINEKNLILEDTTQGMKKVEESLDERHILILKQHEEAVKISRAEGKEELNKFLNLYNQWLTNTKKIAKFAQEERNTEAFQLSKTPGRELRIEVETVLDSIVSRNVESMGQEAVLANDEYVAARAMVTITSAVAIFAGLFLMVQKNAENARRTSDLAVSSNQSVERGKHVVNDMIKAIDDISASNSTIMEQVDHSNQKISDIVKVIAEIGEKTKVINDIVFQTKLLSFNASVEAARAGEHGKGFAVVAEEVGSLAAMSGNAAQEISSMLEESMQKVESIVTETKTKVGGIIQEGKAKVELGSKVARQCGDVLEEIVSNVISVTEMANEISTASQEQAQGVQEIAKAMSQLDQVTQSNAATSEETASAAEELSSQADALRSVVGVLIKTIKGESKMNIGLDIQSSKTSKPKEEKRKSNVIPLKITKEKASFKKVSGMEVGSVPSENDPRFEEV
jgi:methyl-accepting chemotaxis protein